MLNKHRMFYKSLAASFSLTRSQRNTCAAMAPSTKSCAAPASAVNSLAIEQVLDLSQSALSPDPARARWGPERHTGDPPDFYS